MAYVRIFTRYKGLEIVARLNGADTALWRFRSHDIPSYCAETWWDLMFNTATYLNAANIEACRSSTLD